MTEEKVKELVDLYNYKQNLQRTLDQMLKNPVVLRIVNIDNNCTYYLKNILNKYVPLIIEDTKKEIQDIEKKISEIQ